ncbi:putative nuclease HARBI1 [Ornithodoros turicata]|uniref:putative nuclease HARBI1 n=1 Tax=Ornithodoros turicata TaxID=34597 RepID=UPI003138F4B6
MNRAARVRRRHQLYQAMSLLRQRVYRDRENPLESMVLLTLQYLATGDFLITVGDIVSVHESTACCTGSSLHFASRVNSFIRWPTAEEVRAAQQDFYEMAGFPGVVGAVDGMSPIGICRLLMIGRPSAVPSEHEGSYVNRKNYDPINVQVIVAADCRILDVVANWPGSTHDSRILRESTIGREFERGVHTGLLMWDSGYPCKRWLMTPFLQPRDRLQHYNASHSTTWAVVERTIGQLKRRFHCLHSEPRVATRHCCPIITACCVLHNIAKQRMQQLREKRR